MKTFLQLFAAALLGAVVSVVGLQIYDHATKQSVDGSGIEMLMDSIASAKVADYANPVFNTIDEVISYRDLYTDDKQLDEIFVQLPEEVLKNVAGVCISKWGIVSKREIALQYLEDKQGSNIYDNLPVPNTQNNSTDTSTTAGPGDKPDNIISTSYRYRDDTINGKPVKVRIKTEEKIE